MDTKLKKFNLSALWKTVAIILCLVSVAGCTSQVLSSLVRITEDNMDEMSFIDAITYNPDEDEIWDTDTFRNDVNAYISLLSSMIGSYGGGSKEAYEAWKAGIEEYNAPVLEKAKKNLVKYIQNDTYEYLLALYDGVITPLGKVGEVEFYDGGNFYTRAEIEYEDDLSYRYIAEDYLNHIQNIELPDDVKKKLGEAGADGAVKIPRYTCIEDYDDHNGEYYAYQEYQPGYYAFNVNESELRYRLLELDILKHDNYGSYEMFRASYDRLLLTHEQYYESGRYFIMDSLGNTYTNMRGLSSKSTKEEIISAFEKLGFYCFTGPDGRTYLPDSTYYSYHGIESHMYPYEMDGSLIVVGTTGPAIKIHSATTGLHPTLPNTTDDVTEPVTEPVTVPETTTTLPNDVSTSVQVTAPPETVINSAAALVVAPTIYADYDSTPFIVSGEGGIVCYIGADFISEIFSEDDRFTSVLNEIQTARMMLEDIFITCGILLLQFIICFIFLLLRSGRRYGDRENVHLFKLDYMFTDWRIAIDGALGFGLVMLFFWAVDALYDHYSLFMGISVILTVLFAAVVLDLLLFLTRHIKNKSLFKRIFLVWLIRKIHGGYKSKVSPFVDDKLLYTKNFERNTLIKALIIITINAIGIFFGSIEMVSNRTFFIAIILGIFDLVMLIELFRFIGGVNKIFSAVEEIKSGNYDVQINLTSLPSSLREPATRLMSLRDGLKGAVSEAVKQEQTKTELITNVSHDLKTPLTSIINYVELLRKCDIDDEDAKEYLAVLGEKSDRLKKLIEDLVEASKASTGNIRMEIVEVSLNEITSQIIGEYSDEFDKKGLSLITAFPEENITVRADSKMLYRVLENLMGNVAKYAMENTRVYLTVERRGTKGVISIKNISGSPLNITADQLKARFVRGDESRTTSGNGLGLSIAESLCTLQGGSLNIMINGDLFVAEVLI